MTVAFSPLKRRILTRLLIAASILSALLAAVFLTVYRGQLVAERSRASLGFNLLLQAALENAMLKRDVPGLAEIVTRLGTQSGIHGVMILNPAGDIRFASAPDKLGLRLPGLVPAADAQPVARVRRERGRRGGAALGQPGAQQAALRPVPRPGQRSSGQWHSGGRLRRRRDSRPGLAKRGWRWPPPASASWA